MYNNINELPFTLSVEDISRLLGISRVGAYNLSHSEGFPAVRVGKRILIPRERFLEWLDARPEVNRL